VKDEPHKQRRRKWVRYERRYSNSLWHADWFEQPHEQIILFEDDASRFITGFGVFSNANAENSNQVLQQAIVLWPTETNDDRPWDTIHIATQSHLPGPKTEHVSTALETTGNHPHKSTSETPTIQREGRTSWTDH
jgi:hypothetical protein